MEDILQNAIPQQKMALPIAYNILNGLQEFKFENCETAIDGLKIIKGMFNNQISIFFPVFHDFVIDTKYYAEIMLKYPEINKYVVMCAADGSAIIYHFENVSLNDI